MSLKEIASYESLQEAEMAKSLLESAGIPAIIEANHSRTVMPYIGEALGQNRLLVHEKDEERASDCLSEFQNLPPLEVQEGSAFSPEYQDAHFLKLMNRALSISVIGSFFFPVVSNLLALSIYRDAFEKYPYQFSLNKKKFVIGMLFNVLVLGAALLLLMSILLHKMKHVIHKLTE